MEISGLPLHPLVVHAVVGLVPLSVLLGWAMVLARGWRWLTRWLALAAGAGALVATLIARESGQDLLASRPFLSSEQFAQRDTLVLHQERAGVLVWLVVGLVVLLVLAFWLLPAPSGLASGRMGHPGGGGRWPGVVVGAGLLVVGAAALVWVVLTGDAGARAVWTQ